MTKPLRSLLIIQWICLWLLSLVNDSYSFVSPRFSVSPIGTTTQLSLVGLALNEHEDEAIYHMIKARECAYSDTCSIEEAEDHLHEILHIQSGCVSGTLVGHDLCDEQDEVADIVAHLREKVKDSNTITMSESTTSTFEYMKETGYFGLFLLMVFLATMTTTIENTNQGATPFTMQEWWWSLKGGYLDTMVAHYMRNGGL